MTLTTHSAIGAVIGSVVGNPVLGFFLGAISHFLVDMIPHGDTDIAISWKESKEKKWPIAYAMIDAILTVYLVIALSNVIAPEQLFIFSMTVVGAVLPDLLIAVQDVTKWKFLNHFYKFHFYFHDFFTKKHGDIKLRYALAGQAAVILFVLLPLVSR